ncbi:MAG: hypothetical protein ACI9JL_003941 [Paracoccaceae bacterium]|jgi:hypothetical protein
MVYAAHIWDSPDADGCIGATACIVIPSFADRYAGGADWRALAWWIHDHFPYAHLQFFRNSARSTSSGMNARANASTVLSPRAAV